MAPIRSAVARLLFHSGRIADRFSRATVYLSAGARRLAEMQADTIRSWDAFYQTHPSHDSKLLPWEEEFVARFVPDRAAVLVVGCGSGRDLVPLVERDCLVTGIDPSHTGLAIAERVLQTYNGSAKLIEGFFEDAAIGGAFDVVIFSYYSYATVAMASRRILALKKASSILRPGGHVIVSHAAAISPPRATLVRLGRMMGALTRSDWRVEPGDLVSDNREPVPSLSLVHTFEEGELEREAAAANLRLVYRRVSGGNTVVAVMSPR